MKFTHLIIVSFFAVSCTAQKKALCPTQTQNEFVLHHVTKNCGIRNADTLFMSDWVKVTHKWQPRLGDVVRYKNGLIAVIITKPEGRKGRAGQEIYARSGEPRNNGGYWVTYWYYKLALQGENCTTKIGHTTADETPKYYTRLNKF